MKNRWIRGKNRLASARKDESSYATSLFEARKLFVCGNHQRDEMAIGITRAVDPEPPGKVDLFGIIRLI